MNESSLYNQTYIPRKSSSNLSFYSALRNFFYLGGSIWITLIFFIYYMFKDLLTLFYYEDFFSTLFFYSSTGIKFKGDPILFRLLIGIFGLWLWLSLVELLFVRSEGFSYFSFQLFFLFGEGDDIFPRLLLLNFLSWLRDLFIFNYCSA